MDKEEIIKAFSEKIATRDRFEELLREAGVGYCIYEELYSTGLTQDLWLSLNIGSVTHKTAAYEAIRGNAVSRNRWWIMREAVRIALCIYDPIPKSVLPVTGLYEDLQAVLAHVSKADPMRVAYTASIEDGEADRQLTTSLPKLLRKTPAAWFMLDHHYAATEHKFKAVMDPTLTIMPASEIPFGYENGPHSCMVERPGQGQPSWRRVKTGCHVGEVYDMPGWGMAVIESAEGEVKRYSQRSLVWVNPNNPEDKCFIRVYGSGPLEDKLRRNGFAARVPTGAKLKKIPAAVEGYHVMPYLDGANIANNGNGVLMVEDHFVMLDANAMRKAESAGLSVVKGNITCGYAVFGKNAVEKLQWRDDDGNVYSVFEETPAIVYKDGKLRKMPKCKVEELRQAYYYDAGNWVRVYYDDGETAFYDSTNHRYCVDCDEVREALGMFKLDEALYPEDRNWHTTADAVQQGGLGLLKADVVELVQADLSRRIIHNSELTKELKKDYKSIRRVGEYKTYRHKDVAVLLLEKNGRNYETIVGVHDDTVELYDGTVVFASQARSAYHFGKMWVIRHKDPSYICPVFGPEAKAFVRKLLDTSMGSNRSPYKMLQIICRFVDGRSVTDMLPAGWIAGDQRSNNFYNLMQKLTEGADLHEAQTLLFMALDRLQKATELEQLHPHAKTEINGLVETFREWWNEQTKSQEPQGAVNA